MKFLSFLWNKSSNWKSIVGYLIAQVAGSQPLLLAAWVAWLAAPKDPQAILNLLGQGVLAGGLLHKLIKNLIKSLR